MRMIDFLKMPIECNVLEYDSSVENMKDVISYTVDMMFDMSMVIIAYIDLRLENKDVEFSILDERYEKIESRHDDIRDLIYKYHSRVKYLIGDLIGDKKICWELGDKINIGRCVCLAHSVALKVVNKVNLYLNGLEKSIDYELYDYCYMYNGVVAYFNKIKNTYSYLLGVCYSDVSGITLKGDFRMSIIKNKEFYNSDPGYNQLISLALEGLPEETPDYTGNLENIGEAVNYIIRNIQDMSKVIMVYLDYIESNNIFIFSDEDETPYKIEQVVMELEGMLIYYRNRIESAVDKIRIKYSNGLPHASAGYQEIYLDKCLNFVNIGVKIDINNVNWIERAKNICGYYNGAIDMFNIVKGLMAKTFGKQVNDAIKLNF